MDDAEDRTEQPTPRRREEARESGQVTRSQDLTAAAVLLGGLLVLKVFGTSMLEHMLALTQELGCAGDVSTAGLQTWAARALLAAALITLPLLALLMLIAAGSTMVQSGIVVTWKKLAPSLDKLDPVAGLRRLFSSEALTKLGLGLLKMALVGAVAYTTIVGQITPLLSTGALGPRGILHVAGSLAFALALRLGLVLLVLALLDYYYQRWQLERSLRMTRQELRDELKRMEGDPVMKQRRRQIQARLALQRIGIDVPKSDVVVTNPTHYAAALRYDDRAMAAPRLVAKGKDYLAVRIREVAQEHGIPIVQRPPLARALYASVEVGHEVPPMLYRAVAEVLAYVYQLTGRARAVNAR